MVLLKSSFADTYDLKKDYRLSIDLLGINLEIGTIDTYLEFNETDYKLNFNIKSNTLIGVVNKISGYGEILGKIDGGSFIPVSYIYSYKRKNKNKKTEISFKNSNVTKSITTPAFDKFKLTPIKSEMLNDVIDPVTSLIYIEDYELSNQCNRKYKIFDGKRRYNLSYVDKKINDNEIICSLELSEIGGFKKIIKKDIFEPARRIDVYYKIIKNIISIDKIIAKGQYSELIIEVLIKS